MAQLYIRDHVGSLVRPIRELKDFRKVTLRPGESREIEFTLNPSQLAFHVEGGKAIVEPGEFSVWVAPDAESGVPAKFTFVESTNLAAK